MSNKLIITEYGLVSENIDALVTTGGDSALLLIGGESHIVKSQWGNSDLDKYQKIQGRLERGMASFFKKVERVVDDFIEAVSRKKLRKVQNDYWASQREVSDLKKQVIVLQEKIAQLEPEEVKT